MLGTDIQYTRWEMHYEFPFIKILKNVNATEKRLKNTRPFSFFADVTI
jgi:hypothetical protein